MNVLNWKKKLTRKKEKNLQRKGKSVEMLRKKRKWENQDLNSINFRARILKVRVNVIDRNKLISSLKLIPPLYL